LLDNWHCDSKRKVQLTLYQGKKKKRDEVEVEDEDDDVVRICVSQDRVTETLCTEELFLCIQYTYLALPTDQNMGEGGG
jgi:hypothetical protein